MHKEEGPEQGIVWNSSLKGNHPIYYLGAAAFALYTIGALAAYAATRLIQKLPRLDSPKPK